MHAIPLRGQRRHGGKWSRFLKFFLSEPGRAGLDASMLEDRTLFSATPLLLGSVDVDVNEDGPDKHLHLPDLFGLDDTGAQVSYRLIDNSDAGLFDAVRVDAAGDLLLDFAQDQHGTAHLTLLASDLSGHAEQLTLNVNLASVNDAPTMKDLRQFTFTDLAAGQTVINLFGAFDDKEDADHDLKFQVVNNTNPSLFASSTIDLNRGLLILRHAPGQSGSAELTIVATDSGELSVGMEPSPELRIFDSISGWSDSALPVPGSRGLSEFNWFGHWHMFNSQDGVYDTSTLNTERLVSKLKNLVGDPAAPFMLDIEAPEYTNTPEGRDRFAEVINVVRSVRPDLELGLYGIMPEQSYHYPVRGVTTQRHLAWGIDTWYTARADVHQAEYESWLERNELLRTQPVDAAYGGQPLADMVDSVNASLYTFYRNLDGGAPFWRPATLSAASDRFYVDGPSFDAVDVVQVELAHGAPADLGLALWTDYYVVNVEGHSFQLSRTPGGAPMDFGVDSVGDVFIGATRPWESMWHDPYAMSWQIYAEQNISEARKFGKPVYAWISPSFKGEGVDYLEQDFFRWELEILRPLVDGIVIFEPMTATGDEQGQTGWWVALADFMHSLSQPAAKVVVSITGGSGGGNHLPVAQADQLTTAEDTTLNFTTASLLANDRDVDGDPLTAVLVQGPAHGQLQDLGAGRWSYTPAAGYHGTDSFRYQAFDGQGYSSPTTVSVNVSDVNHPPVANSDAFSTGEDQPLSFAVSRVLANDVDADGDRLRFHLVDGPAHGTLAVQPNGTLVYRADANFHGVDHFTYSVSDGTATSLRPATVTLNVQSINDRPVAVADLLQVGENQTLMFDPRDLLHNDLDVDGDRLTFRLGQEPAHGQLVQLSDGRYQYTPDTDFAGSDQFTYHVSDGNLLSVATAVQLDVLPANGALAAKADRFGAAEDQPLVLPPERLLANDRGAQGNDVEIELVDSPSHGRLRWTANGSIVYTPDRNYHGLDRFNYRISDGEETSDIVSVQILVQSRNDLPLARRDVYRTVQGGTLRAAHDGVLANDLDLDSDRLRAMLVTAPQHGSLSLNRDGSFVYRPRPGFSGIDSFQYGSVDEQGASTIARAIIRVGRLDPRLAHGPLLLEEVPRFVLRETSPGNLVDAPPADGGTSTPDDADPHSGDAAAGDELIDNTDDSSPYTRVLRQLGLLSR
jgi:hypothetical protein